jgi:uncharacterized protein YjiS (DUF1127 family)
MKAHTIARGSVPSRSAVFWLIMSGLATRLGSWRRARRAERELLGMDDRLLKDIGISRSDIQGAVRGRHPRGPHGF